MKVNQEIVNHFSCDRCRYWWSIANVSFKLGQTIHCPWCGYENTISEIIGSENLDYCHSPQQAIASKGDKQHGS
jgi:hypothetical protein